MKANSLMELPKERLIDLLLTSIALLREHGNRFAGDSPEDILEFVDRVSDIVEDYNLVCKILYNSSGEDTNNES